MYKKHNVPTTVECSSYLFPKLIYFLIWNPIILQYQIQKNNNKDDGINNHMSKLCKTWESKKFWWHVSIQAARYDCVGRPSVSSRGYCRFTQVTGGCMSGQAAPDACQRTPLHFTVLQKSTRQREDGKQHRRNSLFSHCLPLSHCGCTFMQLFFFISSPVWILLKYWNLAVQLEKVQVEQTWTCHFGQKLMLDPKMHKKSHPKAFLSSLSVLLLNLNLFNGIQPWKFPLLSLWQLWFVLLRIISEF